MSVVGSEAGMEARRVDADSSGARDGVARLSKRPLRGVELRLSGERGSAPRAADRRRAETYQFDPVSVARASSQASIARLRDAPQR